MRGKIWAMLIIVPRKIPMEVIGVCIGTMKPTHTSARGRLARLPLRQCCVRAHLTRHGTMAVDGWRGGRNIWRGREKEKVRRKRR